MNVFLLILHSFTTATTKINVEKEQNVLNFTATFLNVFIISSTPSSPLSFFLYLAFILKVFVQFYNNFVFLFLTTSKINHHFPESFQLFLNPFLFILKFVILISFVFFWILFLFLYWKIYNKIVSLPFATLIFSFPCFLFSSLSFFFVCL